MSKTTLIVMVLMLLASNLLAANFVELKDVSGKHTIKVEINKVANAQIQVTDEKGKTAEYPLNVFNRDSLILILNVVAKMKDAQPPNPFNNSTIVAENFIELKDVSGKHIIKVEINKVANAQIQVTDEKGKTAEYPLNAFDRDSLIIILNVVTKMEDVQKPNDPMDPPPNPFSNFEIKTLTGTGHADYITSVTYSPDGQQIVSTSALGSNIWDANNISNVLHAFKVPTATASLYSRAKMTGYGHDGERITVAVNSRVRSNPSRNFTFFQILEANTGKELHKFRSSQLEDSFTFSPDGKLIASSMDGKSHMIRIRDFNTGKLLKTLVGTRNHTFIAYSPDSKRIVSGTTPIRERSDSNNDFGGGTPTTYTTGEIEIWDVGTGKELHKLETTKLKTTAINCIAYSPNGQRIVGGSITNRNEYIDTKGLMGWKKRIPQNGLIIWDANTGKILHTFGTPHQAHGSESLAVEYSSIFLAYSPDGKRIASLGIDSTINIWDANTGKILHELRMPVSKEMEDERWFGTSLVCFAYSPDGKRIVGGGGSRWARGESSTFQVTGMLCIWDANTGEILDASRSAIKK